MHWTRLESDGNRKVWVSTTQSSAVIVQYLSPNKYVVMREMDGAETAAMDQAVRDQDYHEMSRISHSLITIMTKEEVKAMES